MRFITSDRIDSAVAAGVPPATSCLSRILSAYARYYNRTRTHLAIEKDAPERRAVHDRDLGEVIAFPEVGGLHHRYERRAA